jgi:phosphoglycerate kinase
VPLIEKYLEEADEVFVGGALANEIFKSRGFEIGKSLTGGYLVNQQVLENKKLSYPSDVVVQNGNHERVCQLQEVSPVEMIADIGNVSLDDVIAKTKNAQRILWNGPLGLPESTLVDGTKKLLRALSEVKGEVIIGGGDTVAIVQELGLLEQFSFVSTGGGAMLEFLEKGTLPGIDALRS